MVCIVLVVRVEEFLPTRSKEFEETEILKYLQSRFFFRATADDMQPYIVAHYYWPTNVSASCPSHVGKKKKKKKKILKVKPEIVMEEEG